MNYKLKLAPDPNIKWSNLDGNALTAAESKIADDCRKEKLRLSDSDRRLRELIEWKIYQIHRAAQRKFERQGKLIGSGTYSRPRIDGIANPDLLDVVPFPHDNQSSASDKSSGPPKEPFTQSESRHKGQQPR